MDVLNRECVSVAIEDGAEHMQTRQIREAVVTQSNICEICIVVFRKLLPSPYT